MGGDGAYTHGTSRRGELTVVGVGASAGGIPALEALFAAAPEAVGLCWVIVVHLSPEYESRLAEVLQTRTAMPVHQVTAAVELEPDHVYVVAPGTQLDTTGSELRPSSAGDRSPIDHFFCALARSHGANAIAVVLSGTGTDGTLGLLAVKEAGGLTVAQEPNEAQYDAMPQSAIGSGAADAVLPVARMPETFAAFAGILARVPSFDEGDTGDADARQVLQKIFSHVRVRTGRDFSRYKRSTILRRIARRMQLARTGELSGYLERLQEDPNEVQALADDLVITVTSFFRDPEVFALLEREIVPALVEGKDATDELRVWSVGCATGEEAYSLAMVLLEAVSKMEAPPHIQVFASDLHEGSLDKAREGLYGDHIEESVAPERLERFFERNDGCYRVRREVREHIVFAPHNVLSDPPFSRLDLICCRNLLIYLQRDVQREVMELFHYALRPDGYLVLGTSETVDTAELFQLEHKKQCIYRKRNVPVREPRLPVFPLVRSRGRTPPRELEVASAPVGYGALHQEMVERYAPPSLLVNPDNRIVHLSKHAGQYLVHPGGELTADAFRLVRDELRTELRASLHAARRHHECTRSRPIDVSFDGTLRPVVLDVRPAAGSDRDGFALVIFDEGAAAKAGSAAHGDEDVTKGSHVAQLEAELEEARRRIQVIVDQYETGQEETKASNEELQSANEELRSTLEELETSKEELQSMNEELQTVNQENRHKVEELTELSADLQNLLAATDIATLFLDRELRIQRFTPKVTDILNVRPSDQGRPVSDLTRRLGYRELEGDANEVLASLIPVEREVQDEAGRWYFTRALPYRSAVDRIEGVVITFIDISVRKEAEDELRRLNETLEARVEARTREAMDKEERFRKLVDASAQMVWTTDARGMVVEDSPSWRRFTGQTVEELMGEGWASAVHPDDRAAALDGWRRAVASATPVNAEYRVRHAPTHTYRWTNVRANTLVDDEGRVRGWIGMNVDIQLQKEAEARTRDIASRLTRAEQQERRRLAQTLHDDLQQLLYGIEMRLSLAEQDLGTDAAPELAAALRESRDWLADAIRTTRRLTVDLNPPLLQKEGLADALEWLQRQMRELHGLEVALEAERRWDVPDDDLRVLLFQVVRELLFNVRKHASTERATVRMCAEDGELVIHVVDEGRGFDARGTAGEESGDGFGLASIRERLRLLGGSLRVRSRPGEGTHVEVHVPAVTAPAHSGTSH